MMLLDYRSIWTKIKSAGAKTTSVISSMLEVVSPQWRQAETTWDGWTVTKRGIALGILAVGAAFAWKFSVDITRLVSGSYRSAHAYGYGQNLTSIPKKKKPAPVRASQSYRFVLS